MARAGIFTTRFCLAIHLRHFKDVAGRLGDANFVEHGPRRWKCRVPARLQPGVNLASIFGAESNSSFAGAGKIQRRGQIQANLLVRVRKILPNNDLFVEGTKIVMVGEEEHHLYVSGIVRPVDIMADGSVSSGRVADAEIEYTGRGDASDSQRPGWFSRILSKIWPF